MLISVLTLAHEDNIKELLDNVFISQAKLNSSIYAARPNEYIVKSLNIICCYNK